MAQEFDTPTQQQLRDDWQTEIKAQFPDANLQIQGSVFEILGRGMAMLFGGAYEYLRNIGNSIFVTTCAAILLPRHGDEYGVPQIPASAATGDIIATGTNGTAIPALTRLKAGSVTYEIVTGGSISGGTVTLPVRALTFGANTNQASGNTLSFITPIVGVNTAVTVDSNGLVGGSDREQDEPYRQRILFKKRNPIQGGALPDYITWGLSVANVTRVFPIEGAVAPNVEVRFMMDDKYSDGIPQSGDVVTVQAFIDTLRPAGIPVTVSAPVAEPQSFNISISPNTTAVQDAIRNALQDLFIRESVPGGTIAISKIRQSVSNAVGETDNVVNSPAANISATTGDDIMTLNTNITFVTL